MDPSSRWFCALLDQASDVYFRYALAPARGFAYVSPSVEALTGRAPADFYADRDLCLALVDAADRRRLRRALRARRGVTLKLHLLRQGVAIPVEVRAVALVRHGRVVAIEGVARLEAAAPHGDGWRPWRRDRALASVRTSSQRQQVVREAAAGQIQKESEG